MALRKAAEAGSPGPESNHRRRHAGAGTLYIVSMPLGNGEDITLRALRILRSVSFIAAEDSRAISKWLHEWDVRAELLSLAPRAGSIPRITEALNSGTDVALVCDAGTPLIADPGASIVQLAILSGSPVVPVPGPVAAIAALTASGLDAQRFVFEGFPPRTRTARVAFFARIAAEERTVVLYETRSHLRSMLCEVLQAAGDRRAALWRDISRPGEGVSRGTVSQIISSIGNCVARGEYTVVLEGRRAV